MGRSRRDRVRGRTAELGKSFAKTRRMGVTSGGILSVGCNSSTCVGTLVYEQFLRDLPKRTERTGGMPHYSSQRTLGRMYRHYHSRGYLYCHSIRGLKQQ